MRGSRFPGKKRLLYAAVLLLGVAILATETGEYYLQSLHIQRIGPRTNPNMMSISTLVNYGNGTSIWYNETDVPVGYNFWNLTYKIDNHVGAFIDPTFGEHFITRINGVRSDGSGSNCSICWGIWIYCAHDFAWMYSNLGADLIKLNNHDILSWYIQDATQNNPPQLGAHTVSMCAG